jgi:hypothetical protein
MPDLAMPIYHGEALTSFIGNMIFPSQGCPRRQFRSRNAKRHDQPRDAFVRKPRRRWCNFASEKYEKLDGGTGWKAFVMFARAAGSPTSFNHKSPPRRTGFD